ncbi:MAG: DODA-type extradiol aromatic ring-opening family dioxygenase [Gaiellaceae bacterium]
MIVFAAIAPHGDMELDGALREAMDELGRRFDAAAPEAAIVITPHNVHVEGHFAVVVSARIGPVECDRELAAAALAALREAGLPAVGVSYGGNDATQAEMPLDWGTDVPLAFMRASRVVVISPARDRPFAEHVRAGKALRSLAGRQALIASADHGHAHDPDGPYGYHPAAQTYDALLQEILGRTPLRFEPLAAVVEDARADSLWQLLVLEGAVGRSARAELLSYAAPTYYGMLVAEVRADYV